MPDPFQPPKEPEKFTCLITSKEAWLIQELRKIKFGKVIIHKAEGVLARVEIGESLMPPENIKITIT